MKVHYSHLEDRLESGRNNCFAGDHNQDREHWSISAPPLLINNLIQSCLVSDLPGKGWKVELHGADDTLLTVVTA